MPKSPTVLSAEWINARVINVMGQIEPILVQLLEEGLLSSGYLPLSMPLSPDVIRRLPPEDLVQLLVSAPPAMRVMILEALDSGQPKS